MDNLTVEDLQSICKKLSLSTVGPKADLIERVVNNISKFAEVESKLDGESSQMPSMIYNPECANRVTFVTHLKRRFIDPILHRVSATVTDDVDNNNQVNSWFSILKGAVYHLALAMGAFGGLHSLSQILLFYFGESIQIQLPREW